MTMTQRLIRGTLLTGVLLLCTALIATHGIRGIAVVAAVAMLASVVRTPAFRRAEGTLIRITGSRERALLSVMLLVIVAMIAVSVVQIVR